MLNQLRANRWLRLLLLAVVLGCAGYALHHRWDEARAALETLSGWALAGATVAAVATVGMQMLVWRAVLTGLGSPLPLPTSARIMFVGQLGKYLPGAVWAFVGQMELARDHDVARSRGVASSLLAVAVTMTVNLLVAAATLPLTSPDTAQRWWWALACAPVLLVALHPRVVDRALGVAARLDPRGNTGVQGRQRVSGRGMAAALVWSVLAWVPMSLHVWALTAGAGGDGVGALPVAAGAYALAWTVGVLVVVAPAGLGVRELVLVAGLSPVLAPGSALVVAALSRLVLTLGDVFWAGIALLATRSAAGSQRT